MKQSVRTTLIRMLRATIAGFAALVVLVPAAPAGAATSGALKQLSLPDGCLDNAGTPTNGCGDLYGFSGSSGQPAISPDGKNVYWPSRDSDSLIIFDRQSNGSLVQKSSPNGCWALTNADGCTQTDDMDGAVAAAVSDDGKSVYVVAVNSDSMVEFTRHADGTLERLNCAALSIRPSCPLTATGMDGPNSLVFSPDGEAVYVASDVNGTVTLFDRSTGTGQATQTTLVGTDRCISASNGSCRPFSLLSGVRDIVVSPDGKQVVTANPGTNTVTGFDRAQDSIGQLTVPSSTTKCVSLNNAACSMRNNLYNPSQLSFLDNSHLYVSLRGLYGVGNLVRDPNSNTITAPASGCIFWYAQDAGGFGCTASTPDFVFTEPFDVVAVPQARSVYSVSLGGHGVWAFDLSDAGNMTQKASPFGCYTEGTVNGCSLIQSGGYLENGLASPDGKNLYEGGTTRIWSWAVDQPPVCSDVSNSTVMNQSVVVSLKCSDPDGDAITSYEIVSQPAKGSLGAVQSNGTVTYGPLAGTTGTDTFTYRASTASAKSDPATASITVNSGVVDADGDGSPSSVDCNDNNPGIHPGAFDIPGNGVNEDCSTDGDSKKKIDPGISFFWRWTNKYSTMDYINLANVPAGSTLTVTCKGKGCPFKSKKKAFKKKTKKVKVASFFNKGKRKAKLRVGTVLTIVVSHPEAIGKSAQFKIRKNKKPTFKTGCTAAGATKKLACPS